MKPAPFAYHAPRSVEEALQLLHEHQDDVKVLAGGQSLVPTMNFRLARPAVLVDIAHLTELEGIDHTDTDTITIGARVRHLDLEYNTIGGPSGELFAAAARHVGHYPIRVRGTFGGSLAHADPAAEWCALACAVDADMHCRSVDGERIVPARDFFEGMIFTTALGPAELLERVTVPRLSAHHGVGVAEFARRSGDFAIVLAIAVIGRHDGVVSEARIALGGVAGAPVRATSAEQILIDREVDGALVEEAAAAAAAAVDPTGDIHGSGAYRKDLVDAMVRRALEQAIT